jgi:hypothetical protein
MTIKFFGLIPRRAGMSTAEFHDHYRHPHGTLGLGLPTIKRYVQSHQIHTELLDESQSRFEAVAEDWFDTVEDAMGLSSDPHYLEHIQPDEPLFVDLDNLKWLNTREQFIADRDGDLAASEADRRWDVRTAPESIKLLQFLDAEGAASVDDDRDAERAFALGALRYVRCEPVEEIYQDQEPAYRAVRELWWPTLHDFHVGQQAASRTWEDIVALEGSAVTLLARAERFL